MKSLAPDIAGLFSVFGGGRPRILVEIAAIGGTKFYSDQHLFVDGQGYEARILSWGRMSMELGLGEDFIKEGKVPIKLSNHVPRISDDIDAGDTVSIYIWDLGAAPGSKFKIFEGTVNDDILAGYEEFSFTCTDVSAKYNKLIGDKLDVATYPAADPNDIGKIQPIPYGSNKNLRCLAIEAGAASTLSEGINDSVTTIPVTNTTRFPATDSSADPAEAFIGLEKISWTGKTTTTLTGVTRGIDGTDAASHSHGDAILQAVDTVTYMASSRIAKVLSNARIVPWSSPVSEAVSVNDFATYRVNDSGIATIELDSLPQIVREVNISVTQQPGVSLQQKFSGSAIHNHEITGISQVTIYGNAVDSQLNATNTGNAFDQNFDITSSTLTYTSPSSAHLGLDFDFTGFDGLVIKQAVACIRVSVDVSSNIAKLRLPGSTFGLLNQDLNIGGGIATQKFIVSGLANETDWSKLNTLRILVSGPGGPLITDVYQIWWEISYEPSVSNKTISDGTIATTAGTRVEVGGDSVAASLGGFLICDIDGEPDIAGHWTGSGTDLIEKPVDIIHHILETFTNGPVPHADIDLTGSFADAETEHSNMDKWGFVITQQIWVNELLTYLAQQFFCRFIWEAGIAKLNHIKISSSSVNDKSIDTEWDSIKRNNRLTVKEDRWGKDRVWNDITINFDLDLVLSEGNWFASDNYNQNTQDEDATSITANGRQTRVFNAFAIGDNSTYADDLRDKLLSFYKDNRKWVSFQSWTKSIDLERGDEIDITTIQLGLSSFDAEIVNIEIIFPKKGQSLIPIITALEI